MLKSFLRLAVIASIVAAIVTVIVSAAVLGSLNVVVGYTIAAMTAGILAALVMLNYIDADRADDGLLASVFSLLPRFSMWASSHPARAVGVCGLLLGASTATYMIGPAGINEVTIACDEASHVSGFSGDSPQQCDLTYSERFWAWPAFQTEARAFSCYTENLVPWTAAMVTPAQGACGAHPRTARFASAGIVPPKWAANSASGLRAQQGFDRLKEGLDQELGTRKNFDDTLVFATWNIRNLGQSRRLEEAYTFIALAISYFDIVAFQELDDPGGADPILRRLGPGWQVVYGLESPGRAGNSEQLGFFFDARKVTLGEISSNMVLDTSQLGHTESGQPARPPFLAAFTVNGRRVAVANTHIVFGDPSKRAARIAELTVIGRNLIEQADRSFGGAPALLVGDVQADRPDGDVIAAIEAAGFHSDDKLIALPGSAFSNGRPYDQIFAANDPASRIVFGHSGSFNVLDYVFRAEDWVDYKTEMARQSDDAGRQPDENRYLRFWRTQQISDHTLKWTTIKVDW